MRQKKLIWQIFPANLLILALTVISVTMFGKSSIKAFYIEELEKDLTSRAYLSKPVIDELLVLDDYEDLRDYAKSAGRQSKTRITVILPDGKVVADSDENPDAMELHHNRKEIKVAFEGNIGKALRFSRTLGQEMLYVAVPLFSKVKKDRVFKVKPDVDAVLRMSVPVTAVEAALSKVTSRIIFGVAAFVVIAAIASLLVSRNISRPLEEMKRTAVRFSKGDFSKKMSIFQSSSTSLEVSTLATAMDRMAGQLNDRIETIESQRNELETVFSSMIESVIAVDRDEKVLNINQAAANLLGIDKQSAKGKIIPEVLRNMNLQQQISKVLETGVSLDDEIVHIDSGGEKFLQTNIVSLRGLKGEVLGVLVVLNDVTSLRKLENVRRDFVANVSHELRTPITSIRGYVETLLDGALENKEDAKQFLGTVLRQAERLNEIIEDLLVLSRIEQEADHGQITLDKGKLCMVLDVAIETCQIKAEEQGVTISLQCSETIEVSMNEILIEQAVVNLLVNAIRYSKKGDEVQVVAETVEVGGEKKVEISVIDNGIGISASHLPRLFERFYRSDKARSREQGGTGLGLAIVKHIVKAHNGSVDVTSKENHGSKFTITLPF